MNSHWIDNRATIMPPATRADLVDLLREVERRFPARQSWWAALTLSPDVRVFAREYIARWISDALHCGHIEDLHAAIRSANFTFHPEMPDLDDILRDYAARIHVIALEARHRIANNGAPFPP